MPDRITKKMRFCFICESHTIHSQKWIRFFVGRGHETHVITPSPPDPVKVKGSILHPIQRELGVKGISKIENYISLILKTRSHIKMIKPDLINVLFLTDYGFFGALSRFHPLVMTPWGSDVLRHPSQKRFWYYSNAYSLKKSDLVICNSRPMHNVLVKNMGVSEEKIRDITWNGVDFSIFHRSDSSDLRKRFGLENKVVLFSNRNLEPIYNLECIIRMFARLKKLIPGSVLIIAGGGSQKDSLVSLCDNLNLAASVVFLGMVPQHEIRDYLNIADLYITVPQSDSCASSLLEAFACEAVVIASDIEANRAWIKNGENGWLVNPRDYHQFARVCFDALRRPIVEEALENNLKLVKDKADYFSNMGKVEEQFAGLLRIS